MIHSPPAYLLDLVLLIAWLHKGNDLISPCGQKKYLNRLLFRYPFFKILPTRVLAIA